MQEIYLWLYFKYSDRKSAYKSICSQVVLDITDEVRQIMYVEVWNMPLFTWED